MKVKISLYGILRDKLPPQNQGKAEFDLAEGATINSVLNQLGIPAYVKISVNEELERDFERVLVDGDHLQVFRPVGGG